MTCASGIYVDGRLAVPVFLKELAPVGPPTVVVTFPPCTDQCRNVRLSIFGNYAVVIEGDTVRRLGRAEVDRVLALVDSL